jgi:hypothetical protein
MFDISTKTFDDLTYIVDTRTTKTTTLKDASKKSLVRIFITVTPYLFCDYRVSSVADKLRTGYSGVGNPNVWQSAVHWKNVEIEKVLKKGTLPESMNPFFHSVLLLPLFRLHFGSKSLSQNCYTKATQPLYKDWDKEAVIANRTD